MATAEGTAILNRRFWVFEFSISAPRFLSVYFSQSKQELSAGKLLVGLDVFPAGLFDYIGGQFGAWS